LSVTGAVIFQFDTQDSNLDSDIRVKLLALAALFVVTLINCISVRLAAMVQNALVGAKSVAFAMVMGMAIFAVGMSAWKGGEWDSIQVMKQNFGTSPFEHLSWSILENAGLGVLSALWAYDGYTDLTMVAEEVISGWHNATTSIMHRNKHSHQWMHGTAL
jgi:solute carrier family 7 (L-type amino acid transporter), member 9/15